MEIKTTNIRVQASKNYQVFEVAFEATECTSQDIAALKTAAIKCALKGINELCAEDSKEEAKLDIEEISKPEPKVYNYNLGDVKVIEGFKYKYCYSKTNNQNYWLLVDLNDMQKGAKKYQKAGDNVRK